MKKLKKYGNKFALVMMVMLTAAMLYGCGEEEETTGYELEPATFEVDESVPSWQIDDSTADLTWYVNYDWYTTVWGEDLVSQTTTEETGVSVTFQIGTDENFNQMLAAGDLPDIVTIGSDSALIRGASEWAIPLDVLSAEYDPYFMSTVANPQAVEYYSSPDGHLYGYPNFFATPSDYEDTDGPHGNGMYGNVAFVVREDIYAALGEPDMSTPEAFLDTLRAVQEGGFTDSNGNPVIPYGTIPLVDASSVGLFCNAFADLIGVPTTTEDDEYYDRYADEDFRLWMSTLNQAYQEGLCDPDMLTMDKAAFDSKIINGSYFCMVAPNLNGSNDQLTQREMVDPNANYIAVDGPKSTVGRETVIWGPSMQGWTITFITEDCTNPQKAMELITYMASDYGNTLQFWGVEGETYTMVDGVPVLNEDLAEYNATDPAAYTDEYGMGAYYWLSNSPKYAREAGLNQYPECMRQMYEWTVPYVQYPGKTSNLDWLLSDEDARNKNKIEQNWATTFAAILTAESQEEVDAAYEAYFQYRDENGWDSIVEARNEQIAYNIENLY